MSTKNKHGSISSFTYGLTPEQAAAVNAALAPYRKKGHSAGDLVGWFLYREPTTQYLPTVLRLVRRDPRTREISRTISITERA